MDNKPDVEMFDAQFHVAVTTGPNAGKSFYVDLLQLSFVIHDLNRDAKWVPLLKKQSEIWDRKKNGIEVTGEEIADAGLPGGYFSELLAICKRDAIVPEYTTFTMITELYSACLKHTELLKKKCAITRM